MKPEDILPWTQVVLKTTPNRWLEMASTLPDELLARPPAQNEWSALQCLQHLVDTERMVFPVRVQYLLDERNFPAFDPDSEGTISAIEPSPEELAREFALLREKSLELLDQVGFADLDKKARHQELGIVSLAELLNEWAAHDLMHTVQAERAMMQPFIPGSGPWQPYFSDHTAQ